MTVLTRLIALPFWLLFALYATVVSGLKPRVGWAVMVKWWRGEPLDPS